MDVTYMVGKQPHGRVGYRSEKKKVKYQETHLEKRYNRKEMLWFTE